MTPLTDWLRRPVWRVPRWVWLAGLLLLGLAGWVQFVLPKPAPRAAATSALPVALPGTPIPQPSAAWSPDTAALAVQLAQIGEDTPRLFAASPDGHWLAAGSTSSMTIYSTQSLLPTETLNTPFRIGAYMYSDLAVASDGATVAVINGSSLWLRPAHGAARLIINKPRTSDNEFTSLVFAPDSSMLAATTQKITQVFRATDGALLYTFQTNYGERVLAFSPDGATLLTGTSSDMFVRDVYGWWRFWASPAAMPFDSPPTAAAVAPDGTHVAIGTKDGQVIMQRLDAGTLAGERAIIADLPPITGLAFAPDGQTLAVGAAGDTVRVIDLAEAGDQPPLLHTLTAHTRAISATLIPVFAPDGTLAVAASEPFGTVSSTSDFHATLRHWRMADGALLGEHTWNSQHPSSVSFGADATILEAQRADGVTEHRSLADGMLLHTDFALNEQTIAAPDELTTVYLLLGADPPQLWRVGDGTLPPLLPPGARWIAGVLSPDGSTLAARGTGEGVNIYLVRVADGMLLHTLRGQRAVGQLVFTPDSATLLADEDGRAVAMWRVSDGGRVRMLPGGFGALSPDGTQLATKDTRQLDVWRVDDGALLYSYRVSADWINGVAFASDGTTLAVGDRAGEVALLRAANGRLLHQFQSGTDYVGAVQFTPDGATLLVDTSDRTVQLRQASDGALLHTLTGDIAALAPDGSVLATTISDTVQLWRTSDGALLHTLAGAGRNRAFTPDGTRLITDAVQVRMWRVADGTLLGEQLGPRAWWRSTPSPDGTLRLIDGVGVWRVADGTVIGPFTDDIAAHTFAPDGATIAVTLLGGTVQLRHSADGALLHTLQAPDYTGYLDAVAFAPDSATLAVGTRQGDVLIWRASDGALLHTFSIPTASGRSFHDVDTLAYTADGQLLAVGSSNSEISIWNTATGALLTTLRGHGDGLRSLAFSADDRWLASGARDGTVRLWGVR